MLAAAERMIDRAIDSDPSQSSIGLRPYFEVAKALAEYRRGRFEAAVALLRGEAGQVLTPLPELVRAMAFHRAGAAADARRNLAAAALSFDWSPAAATDHDAWICHALRREAEALILPELEDLLEGREEPQDDDTRAAVIGACVATDRQATAARLCEQLLGAGKQPDVAALAYARAGAERGIDPAEPAERARFRGRAREWMRSELAASAALLETGRAEERKALRARLTSWSNHPAYAVLRDHEAMDRVPPHEREECAALWREIDDLLRRVEEGL